MGKGKAELFKDFEPGSPFRFRLPPVIKGSERERWIYGVFHGIEVDKKGKKTIKWAYWDLRHGYVIDWEQKENVLAIELWDPTAMDEQKAIPVWLGNRRDEYKRSPWTLGDLIGSSWVNQHTHSVSEDCVLEWDRFGEVHLYATSGHFVDKLTMYRDVVTPHEWVDCVIDHWDRYDIMTPEEKIKRAEIRVAYCVAETKATRYNGGPSPSAPKELERAKQILLGLTDGSLIAPEILNAGAKDGDQLSLF